MRRFRCPLSSIRYPPNVRSTAADVLGCVPSVQPFEAHMTSRLPEVVVGPWVRKPCHTQASTLALMLTIHDTRGPAHQRRRRKYRILRATITFPKPSRIPPHRQASKKHTNVPRAIKCSKPACGPQLASASAPSPLASAPALLQLHLSYPPPAARAPQPPTRRSTPQEMVVAPHPGPASSPRSTTRTSGAPAPIPAISSQRTRRRRWTNITATLPRSRAREIKRKWTTSSGRSTPKTEAEHTMAVGRVKAILAVHVHSFCRTARVHD